MVNNNNLNNVNSILALPILLKKKVASGSLNAKTDFLEISNFFYYYLK